MRFSPVLKWSLLLLLPLTLGLKLTVRPGGSVELSNKSAQLRVADFLARQRFTVILSDTLEEGQPNVRATAGACRILVAKSPAVEWGRDLLRRHATPADQVFVVFRGRVYQEQPAWLTVSDFLWSRFRRELGFNASPTPVLGVIASKTCDAERLPWIDLASLQTAA